MEMRGRKSQNSLFILPKRMRKTLLIRRFPLQESYAEESPQKLRDLRLPTLMWQYSKGLLTLQSITTNTILTWPSSKPRMQPRNLCLMIKPLTAVSNRWERVRLRIRHSLVSYRTIAITFQLQLQSSNLYLLIELAFNPLRSQAL